MLDSAGGGHPARSLRTLRRGGTLISLQLLPTEVAAEAARLGIRAQVMLAEADCAGMTAVADLVTQGKLAPSSPVRSPWPTRPRHMRSATPGTQPENWSWRMCSPSWASLRAPGWLPRRPAAGKAARPGRPAERLYQRSSGAVWPVTSAISSPLPAISRCMACTQASGVERSWACWPPGLARRRRPASRRAGRRSPTPSRHRRYAAKGSGPPPAELRPRSRGIAMGCPGIPRRRTRAAVCPLQCCRPAATRHPPGRPRAKRQPQLVPQTSPRGSPARVNHAQPADGVNPGHLCPHLDLPHRRPRQAATSAS